MPENRRPVGGPDGADGRLNLLRLRILNEFERSGVLDVDSWVEQSPEYADQIREFAASFRDDVDDDIRLPLDLPGSAVRETIQMSRDIAEQMFAQAGHDLDRWLGAEIQNSRREGAHRLPLLEADWVAGREVMYPWTAGQLLRMGVRTDHFRTQKTTYLLEKALGWGLFTQHKRTAAGRYDPEIPEPGGIEDLAVEKRYLKRVSGSRYYQLGTRIQDLDIEVDQFVPDVDLAVRLIKRLSRIEKDTLETWTTVEDAAEYLVANNKRVSVPAVRVAIVALWGKKNGHAKLNAANFDSASIIEALRSLGKLGYIPEDRIDVLHAS